MEDFFQIQPPFSGFITYGFLAGNGFGPPFLRTFIFGHNFHIFLEIRANIFKISKERILIMDKNGVIPDVAFRYHFQNTRPGRFVKFEIVSQFFRFYFDDLSEAARQNVLGC
jgi:hypothetical protein